MNDVFLRACRREPVERTPVWFMRQAGRYMPEYRALREKHSLLDLVRTPELAVQVTLQPIQAFPLDAAILFSDLLVPLAPLGLPFDFQQGEGPVVEKPIGSAKDVAALRRFDPRQELGMVLDTIRLLRRELRVPLIGFAQAGAGGFFDDGGFPVGKGWEEIPFPAVTDEHAYALEISGDSMRPAYRDGDVIIVSPGATVRKGDRVVVKTRDGEVMVKELKRKTAKSLELKSLNTEHRDRTLPMSDVLWVARIVWASQ